MVKLVSLLERMKKTPIDLRVLAKLIPQSCKTMQFKQLKGKHRSEIFKDNEGIVVLIPSKVSKIGHFICLLPRRHHIEYFSSLGGDATSEMSKLGIEHQEVMMKLLGSNYIYNSKKLQTNDFHINDCGCWMVARLYLRHLKLRQFQTLFTSSVNLQSSDDIVAMLCVLPFTEV